MNMDDSHLKRDPNAPGAILNTDRAALAAYKLNKRSRASQEQRLNTIEQQISEIHSMLRQLLKNGDE